MAEKPVVKQSRLSVFQELLTSELIDLKRLRQLCFEGCPDERGVRPTCWKLLLGYLPPETGEWEDVLMRQRALYDQLVDEVMMNPHEREDSTTGDMIDHPLNPDPESTWSRYFKDNNILYQIDSDTRRLYPDISFFQLPTAYPRARYKTGTVLSNLKERVDRSSLPSQKVATSRSGITKVSVAKISSSHREPYFPLKEGEEAHWEVVERLLFIYAKVNKGISYVQGMNEIIGPLYYVFAQHPDVTWRAHSEADTFFCFQALMVEIGDHFTKNLDAATTGIGGTMRTLMKLLRVKDPSLHKDLILQAIDAGDKVKKGIDPTFFGFRWITLLLSQEFLLPDVIRIWDSLFADEKRFNFLVHFCCGMIISIRSELMSGDFSECVKLLQNYPACDIQKLLHKAYDIRRFHPL